ncbi:hypothetical protein OAK75_06995 [Bacteriovoracales bacterium]|nr:hypothetical protein [Bacteriovoracales bacterium]
MEINEEKIKSLGDIFESTVKKNFHAYFSDEEFEITKVENRKLGEDISYNNLAMITLTGRGVNVTFKTYFEYSHCKDIIKEIYKEEKYWNDLNFIEDYIKEFCNLFGGTLSGLANKDILELGKSIPMVLKGFDEIYFPINKILSEMVFEWEFKKEQQRFRVRMELSALNIGEILKLFEGAQEVEDAQDLTFL